MLGLSHFSLKKWPFRKVPGPGTKKQWHLLAVPWHGTTAKDRFFASRKGSWCSFVRHYPTEKTREKFRAVRLNSSMTATRSPLNNRVVRSTPGEEAEGRTTTLKGSPYTAAAGALFQSAFVVFLLSAGPSDAAVTERRRFQRHFNGTGRNFSL